MQKTALRDFTVRTSNTYLYHPVVYPMRPSGETFEVQQLTGPPENTNEEDQDDLVWRDVEAETGYSSYMAYEKTLMKSGHVHTGSTYYKKNDHSSRSGEVFVLDIRKDGSKVTSFHAAYSEAKPARSSPGSQSDTLSKISTRLLQNLRSPPLDVPARIVLWSRPRELLPHASIIGALGLGLDIDPLFFRALSQMIPYPHVRGWDLRAVMEEKQVIRPSQIMIGDSIVTMARKYRREEHAPPVLVIAGSFDLHLSYWANDSVLDNQYHLILDYVMNQEINGSTSLFSSALDIGSPNHLASVSSNCYVKLLNKYVNEDCHLDFEANAILLTAMMPLLRIEILRLRGQCSMIDSVLRRVQYDVEYPERNIAGRKEERYNALEKHRFWLRRRLENLQESRESFQNFARTQNAANWLGNQTWLSQDAKIREALAMSRTKELEVRDYMQLQIGNLSISESRKSIQLSNQQMNEAKRGKIFDNVTLMIHANRATVKIRMRPTY